MSLMGLLGKELVLELGLGLAVCACASSWMGIKENKAMDKAQPSTFQVV
jgi:hypothetical protein